MSAVVPVTIRIKDLLSHVPPKVVLGSGFVLELIEVVRQPPSGKS